MSFLFRHKRLSQSEQRETPSSEAVSSEMVDLVRAGRVEEAVARYPEHEPEIRLLVRLARTLDDANLTDTRSRLGLLSEREDLLQQAERASEANDWHRDALRRSRAGDLVGAECAFDEAIRLAPAFVHAHLNRGILHALRDRRDLALADFRAAAALAPESTRARDLLAQAEAGNWNVFKV